MISKKLVQEWQAMAPAWIREVREGRNAERKALLDPVLLEACGDVTGLRVLDSGCGEGRFCRMLAERNAGSVLGLDLCESLIQAARSIATDRTEYRVADVESLEFLAPASFDLGVSCLNQCDLADFQANNRAVFRVLRSGGRFLVMNLHPMRSAHVGWCKTPDGEKLHAQLDRYFDEGARQWTMLKTPFTNFHRSLQTIINDGLHSGFVLDGIVEPCLPVEQLDAWPDLADERRVPNFILYKWRKP